MTLKTRIEKLENKYALSKKEMIIFITDFSATWKTGKSLHSNESMNTKQLLRWQDQTHARIQGEINNQRKEGKQYIVVSQVPHGYRSSKHH